MAERRPAVDAVVLGVGLVGSVLARELTRAGLTVVGLERGRHQATVPDFQGPAMHDELRYSVRKGMMQDNTRETLTFRNNASQTALPVRRWESFLPGTGLGGALVHWNGQTYRFQDSDFRLRTRTLERYGAGILDEGLTPQDWGVSAAELEPHYDRFEYLLGTGGRAGNLRGQRQAGGNPFEDPRSHEYPMPPMKEPYGAALFRKAATELGYHPFPQPSSNMSGTTPTRKASSCAPACSAASASATAASTTPSPRRRPCCCPHCWPTRASSCAPNARCCASTSRPTAGPPPA